MKIHEFESTEEAYAATQCDGDVKDGDLIVVESEKVIGVAETWPFAVTEAHGDLHRVIGSLEDAAIAVEKWHAVIYNREVSAEKIEMWVASIRAGVALAMKKGWVIRL